MANKTFSSCEDRKPAHKSRRYFGPKQPWAVDFQGNRIPWPGPKFDPVIPAKPLAAPLPAVDGLAILLAMWSKP